MSRADRVSFLDRRLFDVLPSWLRPGGVLPWDTFTTAQRALGHPRSPEFLLAPGELRARLAPAGDVLAAREGLVEEAGARAWRAGIVLRVAAGIGAPVRCTTTPRR